MKKNFLKIALPVCVISLAFCSPQQSEKCSIESEKEKVECKKEKPKPHRYGGWYCPDNLNGFPPVDIDHWKNVPVIHGRFPTQVETRNQSSLILVDTLKYPNAEVLNIQTPRLAQYFNYSSNKMELIVVIQAFAIGEDSIVGFRYLNGGNGSARLSEIDLLNDESTSPPTGQFISVNITIQSNQDSIWKRLKDPKYADIILPKKNNQVKAENVNFSDIERGKLTASYAHLHFGCYYIQNDYTSHSNKILLLENEDGKSTEMKIVCGPFTKDYESRKKEIELWAKKVKEATENC